MTTVEFPLKPNQPPVKFKFTVPSARRMELEAGVGIDTLRVRGQSIYAICLMLCHALSWQDKTMTSDKAADLIEAYIDGGGDVVKLNEALIDAINTSGVYGKPKDSADSDGAGADPTPSPSTTVM